MSLYTLSSRNRRDLVSSSRELHSNPYNHLSFPFLMGNHLNQHFHFNSFSATDQATLGKVFTMRCTLALLGAIASASACLIANFQYFPIPEGSAKARPHLIGNLTSTTHPAYPSPICWLTKMKLESPNDMYPLYCIDPSMTAYIWMEGLDPVPGSFFPGLSAKGEIGRRPPRCRAGGALAGNGKGKRG